MHLPFFKKAFAMSIMFAEQTSTKRNVCNFARIFADVPQKFKTCIRILQHQILKQNPQSKFQDDIVHNIYAKTTIVRGPPKVC